MRNNPNQSWAGPNTVIRLRNDIGRMAEVDKVAHAFVRRWGDYAPTEAAFRGDECLRVGNTIDQHFWLYVLLASEDILNSQDTMQVTI